SPVWGCSPSTNCSRAQGAASSRSARTLGRRSTPCSVWWTHADVRPCCAWARRCVLRVCVHRPARAGEGLMSAGDAIGLTLSLLVFVYLLYALFRGERF